ncbi:MAG: sensor histidine kinase, partial [Candidatus Hodarchaeota archaeon]
LKIEKNIYILGDRILLNQYFQNLIINSIDALSSSQTDPLIIISLIEHDDIIEIIIIDKGMGIKEEHLDRIFDPFFTTKKVGEGTGLGLPITRGIIERHKGKMMINGTIGEGTEVLVTLKRKSA